MGWYKLCLLSTGLACVGAALAQADPAVAGSTSVSPTQVSGRRVSVVAAGEARINAPFRSPRVDLISQNERRGGRPHDIRLLKYAKSVLE